MSLTDSFLLAARRQEIGELQTLSDICELVRRTGELIHALQAERGSANAFVASQGKTFSDSWPEKCLATDAAAWRLDALLNTQINGSSRLYARIALATNAFDHYTELRLKVRELNISTAESVKQYSTIIKAHILLIFEAVDASVEPTVSRLLLALFNLIEGKEYAGQERANGNRILAGTRTDAVDKQTLATLIDRQEYSLTRFENFCGDEIRAQWFALQSTLPLRELERQRRQLLSPEPTLSPELIAPWFDVCSTRIDSLHQVERYLADLIETTCQQRIRETQAALLDQQDSLKPESVLEAGWLDTAAATPSESPNHEQRLGSRLNRTLVDLLQQQSSDLQSITAELLSVRAALEDRKLIERAKGLLMAQQGIDEEAAYILLRQKAMHQNIRIGDVANALLSMADFFPATKR